MHRPLCAGIVFAVVCVLALTVPSMAQGRGRAAPTGPEHPFSTLVGAPTGRSAVVSLLSVNDAEARIEFGATAERLDRTTETVGLDAGVPRTIELAGLRPDTRYVYRVSLRQTGSSLWAPRPASSFHTARPSGDSFTFTVQGDSHPERLGRMFDPDLYVRALTNVAADKPDFHFLMGDDFSIERIIERGPPAPPPQGERTQDAVKAVYANQRSFLGIVGKGTPLMLVNGNHEQAAKYLLDGTANNFAVFAGKTRTMYFPLPAPDDFYTGNTKPVEHVGLLRDYYAWEWGDALFVVIDPYWHSDAAVDNEAGARGPARDDVGEPAERPRRRAQEGRDGARGQERGGTRGRGRREGGTCGRSRWVTISTNGSAPRSRRARPSSSLSSATTSRARGAAGLRLRRTTNGAARIGAAAAAPARSAMMTPKAIASRCAALIAFSRPARPGRSRSINSCSTPV